MGALGQLAAVADAAPRFMVNVNRESGFTHTLSNAAGHRWIADEPLVVGGANTGMNPVELLMGSVGSCAAMTVEKAAKRLGWPIGPVDVTVGASSLKQFSMDIRIGGDLTAEQVAHLQAEGQKCAIAQAISGAATVTEHATGAASDVVMGAPDPAAMQAAAAGAGVRAQGAPAFQVAVHQDAGFAHTITNGRGHSIVADAPVAYGGTGTGPSPVELYLSSMGACATMTAEMSANKRKIAIGAVDAVVSATSLRDVSIQLKVHGNLTPDELAKVGGAAERCPVVGAVRNGVRVVDANAAAAVA